MSNFKVGDKVTWGQTSEPWTITDVLPALANGWEVSLGEESLYAHESWLTKVEEPVPERLVRRSGASIGVYHNEETIAAWVKEPTFCRWISDYIDLLQQEAKHE